MLNCNPWALLPPVYSALTAAGLWVVYFVALFDHRIIPLGTKYRKNGSRYPPYISIAGNFAPASCIFSEVMNLAAFVGFTIAVLRYLQVKRKMNKQWLNIISLVAFSIGCFGMTLLGNFQVFADELVHNLGTFMTFGLGTVFCWIQSYITLIVNIKNEGRKTGIMRFILSGCVTVSMVLYFILISQHFHTQAAQCQWALVMFFLIYLSTFAVEFRHHSFEIECTENCGRPESQSEILSELSTNHPNQL
ncbi:transmembrane protein 150C isoform X1 [Xyrichtys novacula]|uniref:Transmembrane protein 150C isoform X1 n=1 Tax=Xyrichtys novacula TaxID=13765 RepID=A0AAV1GB56_XYRNO|nr:transmembrane protein 150C isoform X1 [Xyrichtys novacula]